jgi:methionine aminopeptidase
MDVEEFSHIDIANKYRTAGGVAKKVITELGKLVCSGRTSFELCDIGDAMITDELSKLYKSGLDKGKGIAFPTSVSINEESGYYCTCKEIKDGDIVKIELGVHIDQYPATVCDTYFVGSIDDKKMKLYKTIHRIETEFKKYCRLGKTNTDLIKFIENVATENDCSLVTASPKYDKAPGVYSFQICRGIIDGFNDDDSADDVMKMMVLKMTKEFDYELRPTEFEENEIYSFDIGISTGLGKIQEDESVHTRIYRRNPEITYPLKIKASRGVLKSLSVNGNNFPVAMILDGKTKLGLKECLNRSVVKAYTPMKEKSDQFIARIKLTVAIGPKKPVFITHGKSVIIDKK